MISHKHKCIFIHIAKCAGSTVEDSFGRGSAFKADHEKVFGWDDNLKMFLQHATPQELLDNNLISKSEWNSYYKFVIVRNSWDKSISDYKWLMRESNIKDTFDNYITRSGKFHKILNDNSGKHYRGDHLTKQKDYFFIDGQKIEYDKVIMFDNLSQGFIELKKDLNLPDHFFKKKLKSSKSKKHYSKYYTDRMLELVSKIYEEDIDFFEYNFDDRRTLIDTFKSNFYQKYQGFI